MEDHDDDRQFAVSLIALMLRRNRYVMLRGEAADIMSGAQLYIPKTVPKNRGEEFAVHVEWVVNAEAASALQWQAGPTGVGEMTRYRAIVIGGGTRVLADRALIDRLVFDAAEVTVSALPGSEDPFPADKD